MERNAGQLKVTIGELLVDIELLDTPTTRALLKALPFESRARTWGEEVYFDAPVNVTLEPDAQQVVAPGTVCFWTEGRAIALPFGRTPISSDERPKLAARCNVIGRIVRDAKRLAAVKDGDRIKVESGHGT